MTDKREFSVATARQAAARDQLGDWVAQFLASPGSDNPELAEMLTRPPRCWLGPVRLPVDKLIRLAGPPDDPVLIPVDDEYWRDDVDEMAERIDDGDWEPPPVIVTYDGGRLQLEDGNHRVEGARRAGEDHVWAVVAFDDPAERDGFVPPRPNGSGG